MFSTAFFPKPTDSWPMWAHVVYWTVVTLVLGVMAVKTFMKSFARVEQGHVGIRMRFERPIRVNPRNKDESCAICDERALSCNVCKAGRYCVSTECPDCERHDELKMVGPGWHWQVPFTHSMREPSVQDTPVALPRTPFEYVSVNTRRKFEVDGAVTYNLLPGSRAAFRSLFASRDLPEMVQELASASLANAVAASAPGDIESIGTRATELFNEAALAYGVHAVRFTVKPVTRADAQVLADAMMSSDPAEVQALVGTSHLGLVKGS